MKKTLTIIGVSLLTATFLIIISALILGYYINPNKFKGRISQFVFAKTGQVLVINGNMEWSLFPWIGLKANNLAYYNPSNFIPKIFMTAKEMDIKVKLTPLIAGKIEIGNITLSNAEVNITKNKKGEYNWQSITKHSKNNEDVNDTSKHSITNQNFTITSLKIKNSKLNWYDQQNNSQLHIASLNILGKEIKFNQAFPISLQFDLLNDDKKKILALDFDSDLRLIPNQQQYELSNTKLKGELFNTDKNLAFKATSHLLTNLEKQTLTAEINFALNDLKGKLNLNGSQITNKPHISGLINIDSFNLQKLLKDIGQEIELKNSDSLKNFSVLAKVAASDSAIQLTDMHAKIDQIDVFGKIIAQPKIKNLLFNLSANEINMDNYLPAEKVTSNTGSSSQAKEDKVKIKKATPWTINGTLKINRLAATDKLKLSSVVANLNIKNKVTRISPLQANLYQGNLKGEVTIDKRQEDKTAIYIKQNIKNLNIQELLHELSDSDKLSGTTDLSADLVSITNRNTSFLQALNGKIDFVLANGYLKGVDVIYQLSRAHAFLKHLPSPGSSDSKKTQFSSLKANASVNHGVINTDNLSLSSDYLKVNGKGTTNLVTKEVRYHLNALAQPRLAEENKEIGKEVTIYQVPIKISGRLNKPSVNLDFAELAKMILLKKIEKPIAQHLGKEVDSMKKNIKEKVQDQIQDKIKGYAPGSILNKLMKSKDDKNAANP